MLYSIYYLFSLRRGICLLTIEFHMARVLFFFVWGEGGYAYVYIYIIYIYIFIFFYITVSYLVLKTKRGLRRVCSFFFSTALFRGRFRYTH